MPLNNPDSSAPDTTPDEDRRETVESLLDFVDNTDSDAPMLLANLQLEQGVPWDRTDAVVELNRINEADRLMYKEELEAALKAQKEAYEKRNKEEQEESQRQIDELKKYLADTVKRTDEIRESSLQMEISLQRRFDEAKAETTRLNEEERQRRQQQEQEAKTNELLVQIITQMRINHALMEMVLQREQA